MDYWKKRLVDELERTLALGENELNTQLRRFYRESYQRLKKELLLYYYRLLSQSGQVNDIYQFKRYYQLIEQIQEELKKLGMNEEKLLTEGLQQMYIDTANMVAEQLGFKNIVITDYVEQIVKRVWTSDGVGYSRRIWKNKGMLANELTSGLIDTVAMGENPQEFEKRLIKKFDVSFREAERLVRTEMAHIRNVACIQQYQNMGFTMVEMLVTDDERTCEVCMEMDGRKYPIATAPILPMHPNCRCDYIPVLDSL